MPLKGRRAEVQKMTTGLGNSPRPVPMLKNTTKTTCKTSASCHFFSRLYAFYPAPQNRINQRHQSLSQTWESHSAVPTVHGRMHPQRVPQTPASKHFSLRSASGDTKPHQTLPLCRRHSSLWTAIRLFSLRAARATPPPTLPTGNTWASKTRCSPYRKPQNTGTIPPQAIASSPTVPSVQTSPSPPHPPLTPTSASPFPLNIPMLPPPHRPHTPAVFGMPPHPLTAHQPRRPLTDHA